MHPENHFGDTVIGFIVESVFIFRVQFNYIHCEAASTQSFLTKSHTNRSLSMHSQKNPTSLPVCIQIFVIHAHKFTALNWNEESKNIYVYSHMYYVDGKRQDKEIQLHLWWPILMTIKRVYMLPCRGKWWGAAWARRRIWTRRGNKMGIGAPVISDALHAFVLAKWGECCSHENLFIFIYLCLCLYA